MRQIFDNVFNPDLSNLSQEAAQQATNALQQIRQAIPAFGSALINLAKPITSLSSIWELPSVISNEVTNGFGGMIGALRSLVNAGIPLTSVMPNTLRELVGIFQAAFYDSINSPEQMFRVVSRFMLKQLAPGYIARFL